MLDAHHLDLMARGSLIVGVTDEHGTPYATRAWGLRVVEQAAPGDEHLAVISVLLAADDRTAVSGAAPGRGVAVTAADVLTLRSAQLKGRSTGVDDADDDDLALSASHFAGFAADVTKADGQPLELLSRLLPHRFARCTVVVDEAYDQTPGPGAGEELSR